MKKSLVLAAIPVLALAASLTGQTANAAAPAPAKAAPHANLATAFGTTQRTALIMANQPALDALADHIRAAHAPAGTGISGVTVDALTNTLHLYWHGPIPAQVDTLIARARHQGRTVTVTQAKYTEAQLIAEAHRLINAPTSATAGIALTSAGPADDGSGLELGVAASKNRSAAATDTRAAHTALSTITGFPITVSTVTPHSAQGWTGSSGMNRANGGPGLYNMAGEHINMIGTGHICSAGWAATYQGHDVVLTAGHCGWNNFSRNDGVTIGRTVQTSQTYDVQAISGTNSYSYGDVWLGPDYYSPNGSGQWAVQVNAVWGNSNGDWVCTSGAETGYVCNIQVYRMNDSSKDTESGITYYNLIDARDKSPNFNQIVAGGDSGGPVFVPTSSSSVAAKGIIHGAIFESGVGGYTTCRSTAAINDGNPCYDTLTYVDANTAASYIGATIKHW